MKLLVRILLASLLMISTILAQKPIITCTTVQNNDRSLSIYATCDAIGEYSVKINFTSLEGYNPSINRDHVITTVYKGRTEVVKLTPIPSASSFSLNYNYQYFTGSALSKKPDTTFTYLLPSTLDNKIRVSKVTSIATTLGQTTPEELVSTGFIYHFGDTVCAVRAGTIFENFDGVQEGEKGNEFFRKERNHIFIVQKDGTLAYYYFTAPIKLLVEEGEKVIPGEPIALFNKESDKYRLLLSVNYLDEKKIFSVNKSDPSEKKTYYKYLPLLFLTDETSKSISLQPDHAYVVTKTTDIIGKELNKKEKKKRGLQ